MFLNCSVFMEVKTRLLDLFDKNGYPINGNKTIDEVYVLPSDVKNIIKKTQQLSRIAKNNNNDNYVEATVKIGNIEIYTYSDYRRNGCKTGGRLIIKFKCDEYVLTFDNDYDFISDSLYTSRCIDKMYDNIKKNKTTRKILDSIQVASGINEPEFSGFFKLLFFVPGVYNEQIY